MNKQDGSRRFKNFDTIRLLAASSVIFSHSFLIAEGHERNEPLVQMLGEKNIIGFYGVFIFLIISGFLVTYSLKRSASIKEFIWKRTLRIYPALACCAVMSVFFIAPFFWTGQSSYFQSYEGPKHLFQILALQNPTSIPGVIYYEDGGTTLGSIFNGSIWTIPQEVNSYIILVLVAALGLLSFRVLAILLPITIVVFALGYYGPDQIFMRLLCVLPSFFAGVLMYFIYSRFGISFWIVGACVLGLIISGFTGWLMILFPIFGAYLVVSLGASQTFSIGNGAKFGDISYGTYLYGWPIQQALRSLLGDGATWWGVFLLALPLAFLCGWISWHLIEKRALSLKHVDPVSKLSHFFGRRLVAKSSVRGTNPIEAPRRSVATRTLG